MSDTYVQLQRSAQYVLASEKKAKALSDYNYAGYALTLAQIREREAELGSQAFSFTAKGLLAKRFGDITDSEREIGLAFARYAVTGRTD